MGDPARPLIAVPARFAANTSALRYEAEVGARALISAVYAAGGEPLQVHPHAPGGVVSDDEVADRLRWADGILLPGGGDLAAHWSGQQPHPALYDVHEEQDAFDLSTARVALELGIPMLAVCRGLQVVNAARGGTVVQDMDELEGAIGHHRHRVHQVTADPGHQLAHVVGDTVDVSCYHHQCIATLGDGLVVTARSEEGVIEGLELPESPGWFLGVQWHPEDTWRTEPAQLALFRALVDAASLTWERAPRPASRCGEASR